MIKIKSCLNGFRVIEVADIDLLEGGEYSYYVLVKAGLRTDEYVSIISEIMRIERGFTILG